MATYVIFDGDNDSWAYRFIRGWSANRRLGFTFKDSHDLDSMTSRAQSEEYVKRNLRARMESSTEVIVLLGEKTKNLYRYVRWEIELAKELDLPIVVVNLNKKTHMDGNLIPALLREHCALHIAFRYRAIKNAISTWPSAYRKFNIETKAAGPRHYPTATYNNLGIYDI